MHASIMSAAARRIVGVCLGCGLLLGVVPLSAQPAAAVAAVPGEAAGKAADSAMAGRQKVAPAATILDEYQIGAHDLLEISVFQVADLSRTVRVNSRGMISLPLIGAVQAGGLTAHELETSIAKKLAEGLLQDPQVSIFIKEYVSQRVVVEGSVQRAGVYPLTGRTTLLQVIAMASGFDPLANENEVKIFRQIPGGSREAAVYDLEAIRAGHVEDPLIKGNDLVVVEKSGGRSFVKGVTDTLRGFIGFGTLR